MAYASRSGRARTSPRNPQAFGVCDRCSFWYNRVNLGWQHEWRGASVQNIRLLVCPRCMDNPQQQLRAIVIPGDPMPISNPRVEPYIFDEIDRRQLSGANTTDPRTGIPVVLGDIRVTSDENIATDDVRVPQQTGEPPFGTNQEPGTDPNVDAADTGLPYGFTEVPKTGPL